MVLAIKLHDNIFIPKSMIDSGKHLLGLNYTLAQNKIKSLFPIDDGTKANRFIRDIFTHIKPNFTFNLYHLVDSLSISELLIANDEYNQNVRKTNPNPPLELLLPIENYLNYLGFEIAVFPTAPQLFILNLLKKVEIISEYWLEGETRPIDSSENTKNKDVFGEDVGEGFPSFAQNDFKPLQQQAPANPDINENNVLNNLDYDKFENRGEGATFIIIESDATNDLKKIGRKVNVSHLNKKNTGFLDSFGEMSGGALHQLQTLITLYGNAERTIQGLAPETNLVVCSLQAFGGQSPVADDFINRKKNLLSLLRECLFKVLKSKTKNAILLLEFETSIPLNKELAFENFPSYIISDVHKRLAEITNEHNTIVVGGVGNSSKNFNNLSPFPWKIKDGVQLIDTQFTYIDLTKREKSPIIMVAATEKMNNADFTIAESSNYGKEVDIYMYTNILMGDDIKTFTGTSAASAVTAGIIAFLQGRTLSGITGNGILPASGLQNGRKLTTQIIKKVFENTFMSDFRRKINTPLNLEKSGFIRKTTLEELWIQCEIELNRQASQRQ